MLKNRILLADDDLELGKILQGALKSYGYDIQIVDDGEKAISQLNQHQFDLAIVDISMPKVDGFGVLKFIKEKKPEIKIIMLTAYADLMHAAKSMKNGADDFICKPFGLETLRNTIETLLQ
jgi:two-component system response regulator PilR (NtrC family)